MSDNIMSVEAFEGAVVDGACDKCHGDTFCDAINSGDDFESGGNETAENTLEFAKEDSQTTCDKGAIDAVDNAEISQTEQLEREAENLFFSFPKACDYADEIGVYLSKNGGSFEKAYTKVLEGKVKSIDDYLSDPCVMEEKIFGNEAVRTRIVGDYLEGLARKSSPRVIGGGGSGIVTPPDKVATLSAAKQLVLKMAQSKRMS